MRQLGLCQGVCGIKIARSLFASGPFAVCLSCLTSAAWAAERRRREAETHEEEPGATRREAVRG